LAIGKQSEANRIIATVTFSQNEKGGKGVLICNFMEEANTLKFWRETVNTIPG
jgi:hypothetical protein